MKKFNKIFNLSKHPTDKPTPVTKNYIGVQQIIEEMERAFPPLEIKPETSDREILYNAGQRNIIKWLKTKYDIRGSER